MGSISVLRAWLHIFWSDNTCQASPFCFLKMGMLIGWMRGKTAIYLTEKDTKQQTKAGEVIINDIPEHLALDAAQLDNKRLVIEQVLVCMSGRSVSNVGNIPWQTPFSWKMSVWLCTGCPGREKKNELIKLLAHSGGDDGDALSLATCKHLEKGATLGWAILPAGLRTAWQICFIVPLIWFH